MERWIGGTKIMEPRKMEGEPDLGPAGALRVDSVANMRLTAPHFLAPVKGFF